jgi:uncharacterized membrane protein
MRWWQWILIWFLLSLVLAPVFGAMLKRQNQYYPEAEEK